MNEEQVKKILYDELGVFFDFSNNKIVFKKDIQMMDGRKIQVGRATGLKIGTETTQKLSVFNVVPVVQAGAIGSPSADVNSLKSAVDAIRTAIKNFGITA